MYYQIINSPIGPYLIVDNGKGISRVDRYKGQIDLSLMEEKATPLLEDASQQLEAYFSGKTKTFSLPLATEGTPFQEKVWAALREIPYGEVRTYKDIAIAIENPKAIRAVGMANNRNPVCILTPCHRVIGSNGKLVGYVGGLDAKEYLLLLESKK